MTSPHLTRDRSHWCFPDHCPKDVCMSVCLSVCLSVHPSAHPSTHPSVHPSLCLPACTVKFSLGKKGNYIVLGMAVRDCFYRKERELKWVPGVTKSSLLIYLDFSRISGNNSNNGENFPPSAACCHFSREEIFCHLVQALLRAKTPIFTRCSTIICTICCCLDSSFFLGACLSTGVAEHC